MNAERLVIDEMMKELRQVVDQTGVHIDVVSQLRKTQGTQYEEGGRIGLQDLRGSGSLASVPNVIVAMERNRQHPDAIVANTSILRVLKDRFAGHTGMASALRFNHTTGRLEEVEWSMDDDGDISMDPRLTLLLFK